VVNELLTGRRENRASRVIDLLLVTFNSAHLLQRLRETLAQAQSHGVTLRLLAVDNASSDRSAAILRRAFDCEVLIRNRENVGFGRANNQLLAHVHSDYALLLNTDAFVSPHTIAMTVRYMDAHPRCGILGVRLTDADGTLQPSRRDFPTPATTFLRRTGLGRLLALRTARHDIEADHNAEAECDWVPGCYYLVRRAVLEDIGLFDPRFFLYFEEVDHCRRAREAGWTVTYLPSTSVVHLGGESAKSVSALCAGRQISVLQVESELLYMRKHFGRRGLWWHLLLVTLGDAILAGKDLLKAGPFRFESRHDWCSRLTWRLARRTAWGTRPTR
jgi:N-acetylglucosaminyl-diphospho-decaprenol L-rhamnosyltransferase